ncbi:hypothetical protein HYS50_00550 [Candidatus Woesearchaeota archaeon]|nr:hypothetical protein [Candidatus Woesearchaeota archaeon]
MEVYIHTFTPEPYEVRKPIPVILQREGKDNCTAGWYDANIHSGGANEQEAFDNLKSLVLDAFESLRSEKPESLGPEPKRCLAVLNEYLYPKRDTKDPSSPPNLKEKLAAIDQLYHLLDDATPEQRKGFFESIRRRPWHTE